MISSIEYLGYELNTKLFYNISPELWEEVNQIFKQAKAMHKDEMIDFAFNHAEDMFDKPFIEENYNETFK